MSIRVMSLVWEINFPTHSQKLIALKLADYASDHGASIFPAVSTLARHTGSDERTVQRVMKAFRDCGLIELVKEGGAGPKSPNHWQLNLPLMVAISLGDFTIAGSANGLEIEGEDKGDILSCKGDILSVDELLRVTKGHLRVTPVSPKGGSGATQSINNHQIDSSTRAGACAMDGAAPRAEVKGEPALVLKSDPQWRLWINWLRNDGHDRAAIAFESEGAMIVYAPHPSANSPRPKLAPGRGSARWDELHAQRKAVNVTARITGEHVE